VDGEASKDFSPKIKSQKRFFSTDYADYADKVWLNSGFAFSVTSVDKQVLKDFHLQLECFRI
jgi:hypothetical protein